MREKLPAHEKTMSKWKIFTIIGSTPFMAHEITLLLALVLLSGCAERERSFEEKRDFAIRFNKERLASSNSEVRSKWSKDVLSALALVNSTTIKNPRLISATLTKGKNGSYGLFVFWMENYPSVDGIAFQYQRNSSPLLISIPESEFGQLRAEAKNTIVFGSENDWRDVTEFWKSLERIDSAKELKVRLLRGKATVTDWFPVDFYKQGKWVAE